MCHPCHSKALRLAPVIIEVPQDHENYKSGTWFRSINWRWSTDQCTVKSQFQQSWRHPTTCPEVRAVYKIVITTTSQSKYDEYQCDRPSIHISWPHRLNLLTTGTAWKLGEISHLWASHAETRIVVGTEREGNATSEIKESRPSVRMRSARCVVSSRIRTISVFSREPPVGGGSGLGSTLRRPHQSWFPFRRRIDRCQTCI